MKSLYEELGGTYHQEGNYLIPDITLPPSPHIGIWGIRRKNYLLKNRGPIYTAMLLSGELSAHLEEVDRQAAEMLFQMVNQMLALHEEYEKTGNESVKNQYQELRRKYEKDRAVAGKLFSIEE